jgi:hypothetical protein
MKLLQPRSASHIRVSRVEFRSTLHPRAIRTRSVVRIPRSLPVKRLCLHLVANRFRCRTSTQQSI